MSPELSSGWYLTLVGWPFWAVLPLAALAWYGLRRLAGFELASRTQLQRRGLLALRGAAVLLLVLLLLEPIFSRRLVSRELPVLSVLIDTSGSMRVRDAAMGSSQRLDEAIALGLVEEKVRDTTLGAAGRLLTRIGADLPEVVSALEPGKRAHPDQGSQAGAARVLRGRLDLYLRDLGRAVPRLAGQAGVGKDVKELLALLRRGREALAGDAGAGGEKLRDELRGFQARVPELAARCRRAQRAADAAMVSGAGSESAVTQGLERLDQMSRYQRVELLARKRLLPLLEGRAIPRVQRLNRDLAPLDLDAGSNGLGLEGATDFAAPLTALARGSGGDRLGAVLLLSDGRQTAGDDPVPALRALRARGVRVGAVVVGDPAEPRDAAVAEILGSREVFQGETIQLDVRFRIVGYANVPWDLVLTRGGEEVERRRVKGSGKWQRERFEVPAGKPGLVQFRARLEMDRKAAVAALAGTVAYWACNEGRGLEVADAGDDKVHARVEGAPPGGVWQQGRAGQGLKLTGAARLVLKKQPRLGASWSLTGWFLAPSPRNQHGGALLRTRKGSLPVCVNKDMKLGVYLAGKRAGSYSGFSLAGLKPGWHHLAAVAQGQGTSFFIDGLRAGNCDAKATGALWTIGNGPHGKRLFSGGLDELRLHNRALNPVEVKWMMQLSSRGGGETGYVLREVWENVAGEGVAQLTGSDRFARAADRQQRLTELRTPASTQVRYGARICGFLAPKQSGSYSLLLSADDHAELWMGSGADRRRKTLILSAPAPGESGAKAVSSRAMMLSAGRRYYFEVLHKQGEGSGHLSVGWKRPDGKSQAAIPGEYLLPALPGAAEAGGSELLLREASNDNNQADLVVSINKDPLKVLLVDAYPRWDSRYLTTMLERDRRVKLVRRYRAVRVPRGELELLPASQEELDSYSMIIFGDLKPSELRSGDQKRLVDFVGKRGGFLVVLAGPRGLPGRYSLGGLAGLLPVKTAAGGDEKSRADAALEKPVPVRLRLSARGEKHPATMVLDDPALNRKLWPALSALIWVARGVTAKPGAQVLLQTDDPQATPIAAISRYGAGRVLYLGTDESWRWRDRLGDRIHQTFWLQAIRWGLGLRLRGKDSRLQVALARSMMAPQDETELRARGIDKDGKALKVKMLVRVRQLGSEGATVPGSERVQEMTPLGGGAGIHQLSINGLGEGRWRLEVSGEHPALKDLMESRELLVQRQPGREGVELGASPATLSRLTRVGGHRSGDFSEAPELVESLVAGLRPRRLVKVNTYSLWDNYVILMAAVGLLVVEWVWRKRQGLP
jgi:Concanavalin A-like lectin/glucanases superfamily/PA14 domain